MPNPALRMGVRPILGFMIVPVNGPTGVLYRYQNLINLVLQDAEISTYSLETRLLKGTGGFDSQDQANLVDSLAYAVV